MCGIAGIARRDGTGSVDPALLETMLDLLRHRGPDAAGSFVADGIGLGSRRLSIIDLETGDQPIANEDGTVHVVCNGEIYNYVEFRAELSARGHVFRTKSDTEVIVHLYEEEGVDCVRRLRGMFAIALWDSSRRRLLLSRDRFGIKPLHYAETACGLCFASEQKAILAVGDVPREIDAHGVADVFTLGFVAAPATMFASIRQLLPGTSLTFEDSRTSIHRYWDPAFPPRDDPAPRLDEREWAEALREKLEESVRLHLRSDVPVGAWLSGGLDSSAVVALMSRQLGRPVHVASLGFDIPGMDEIRTQRTLRDFPEYDLVSRLRICTLADFARLPEALWFSEQPTTSGLDIVRLLTAEESARDVKVILTGEGADEVFGGYRYFQYEKLLRPLARLPQPVKRAMMLGSLLPQRFPRPGGMILARPEMTADRYRVAVGWTRLAGAGQLFSPDLASRVAGLGAAEWDVPPPASFPDWHPFSQLQYYDLKVRLPSFVNHAVDRASMARSVEARVPFLDHELVELAARIPPCLKMKWLREKHILREAVADCLPHEIVNRRKRGLNAPTAAWLRAPLPEFASDLLSEASLRKKGYFDPASVRRCLVEHQAGHNARTYELFGVLSLQLWDEIFLRGNRP
jgi:asparagine synthase (glutamine-hydrolysing)